MNYREIAYVIAEYRQQTITEVSGTNEQYRLKALALQACLLESICDFYKVMNEQGSHLECNTCPKQLSCLAQRDTND